MTTTLQDRIRFHAVYAALTSPPTPEYPTRPGMTPDEARAALLAITEMTGNAIEFVAELMAAKLPPYAIAESIAGPEHIRVSSALFAPGCLVDPPQPDKPGIWRPVPKTATLATLANATLCEGVHLEHDGEESYHPYRFVEFLPHLPSVLADALAMLQGCDTSETLNAADMAYAVIRCCTSRRGNVSLYLLDPERLAMELAAGLDTDADGDSIRSADMIGTMDFAAFEKPRTQKADDRSRARSCKAAEYAQWDADADKPEPTTPDVAAHIADLRQIVGTYATTRQPRKLSKLIRDTWKQIDAAVAAGYEHDPIRLANAARIEARKALDAHGITLDRLDKSARELVG